jgi:hypothetical protein
MGHNYKFRPSEMEPLEVYINDFNNNGRSDFVLGYHQEGKIFPTVDRNRTLLLNRYLKNKIPSNDLYALMELEDIYGLDNLNSAKNIKVHTHSSGILENKGNGAFEFKAFDEFAQISVTNSMVVNDFDEDGFSDLILAGNFHLIEAETIRMDAGIGLLMLNDKKGNFKSIPYHKSGLFLDGDVRDLKMLKTAGDPIIVCSKNNDYVQLIKYAQKPKTAF